MRRRAKLGGKIAEGNGEAARKGPREMTRWLTAKVARVDFPSKSPERPMATFKQVRRRVISYPLAVRPLRRSR